MISLTVTVVEVVEPQFTTEVRPPERRSCDGKRYDERRSREHGSCTVMSRISELPLSAEDRTEC